MAKKTAVKKPKPSKGFTTEEREAMQDRVKELKGATGEPEVLSKIAAMPAPDRTLAERVHSIIKAAVPALSPRLWYGMPAYAKGGDVVCFFQPAHKFKARYAMLGFSDKAKLDAGHIWPTYFAVTELTPADEAEIAALVKQAAG